MAAKESIIYPPKDDTITIQFHGHYLPAFREIMFSSVFDKAYSKWVNITIISSFPYSPQINIVLVGL